MKRHKLYFTDESGGFNGYDRQKVWVDEAHAVLRVGTKMKIPLGEITAVEVRPLPAAKNGAFLAIDVCGPTVGNYGPTTLRLIHKNFFAATKVERMQALVDELAPLVQGNVPLERPAEEAVPEGTLQAHYALNISLLIGYYHKIWYSYDGRRTIAAKTVLLMLLGGVVNIAGILLFVVPIDNLRMASNLQSIGWPKARRVTAYIILTYPAYAYWLAHVILWITKKG